MATPYKQRVSDQIITLLEAHAPFTAAVLAGNRANQAGPGWLRERIARVPNDFPRIFLTNGRFTNSVHDRQVTYGAGTADYPGTVDSSWYIRRRLEFQLVITAVDLKSTSIDPTEEAAQTAILLGGANLGLSFVLKVEAITALHREVDFNGVKRLQSTITIPVECEFTSKTAVLNA